MRVLITGAKGMLAQAVKNVFAFDANGNKNEIFLTDVQGTDDGGIEELDITDGAWVIDDIDAYDPDIVVNCAAYTNVDAAEENEDLAYKINAEGPSNLAEACKIMGVVLVHISTDYVFGGGLDIDKEYSEDDGKMPETAYGRTKLAGEEKIIESIQSRFSKNVIIKQYESIFEKL